MISELNERSRDVFCQIVENYVATGEPIGSRTLSKRLAKRLSAATIRNVMSDLEEAGLLFSPHTSSGRLPTDIGLRLFVDGILEVGNLTKEEREIIEKQCAGSAHSMSSLLEDVTIALSGLSGCASLVLAPKTESPLKHIEFFNLSPGRTLVVLVTESGIVENRVFTTSKSLPPSVLLEATNYLSSCLLGRTLGQAYEEIMAKLKSQREQLDELTKKVVGSGLATWAGGGSANRGESLIVRGQANLLGDVTAIADLENVRSLFGALETKEEMLKLLSLVESAEGVQIFIGADNTLFNITGCAMVVNSFKNSKEQIVGAIGVVGPTRMNYGRIIPMVDYTAKLISKFIG
jgi:heat-inducible transcriptional repressor